MTAALSAEKRALLNVMCSRLLAYPDEQFEAERDQLVEASNQLPPELSSEFAKFFAATEGRELLDLQAEYVRTFDVRRRACLYLSYYLNGDTRRRGAALWRFQETYKILGFEMDSGELPDFLPMLLEAAAHGGDAAIAAEGLLDEHRQGLEVLISALERFESPQVYVVRALVNAMPEITTVQRKAAEALIAGGPPTELVGIDPLPLIMKPYDNNDSVAGARS